MGLPADLLLPPSLWGFIWQSSGWHQLWLSLLAVAVFLLGTAPLELQRRMVNDMVVGGKWHAILLLSLFYVGLVIAEGLVKLVLNIYGSWVSENAVRGLRQRIARLGAVGPDATKHTAEAAAAAVEPDAVEQGVEASLILNEVEPVGGFIGTSVQQPLLQGGILLSVFGYLTYLNPIMALVGLGVFVPQIIFVPLMQWMINRRAKMRIATLREIGGGVVAAKQGTISTDAPGVARSRSYTKRDDKAAALDQSGRVDRIYQLNMGIYKLKFSMNFLMNLMYRLGVIGTLAVGGWFVIEGRTELGTVMAFISGLARVNDPWGDIIDWFREMAVTRVKYAMIQDAAEAFWCRRSPVDDQVIKPTSNAAA